jgi:hypothetical protein
MGLLLPEHNVQQIDGICCPEHDGMIDQTSSPRNPGNNDKMNKVETVEAFLLKKKRPGVPRLAAARGRWLDAP